MTTQPPDNMSFTVEMAGETVEAKLRRLKGDVWHVSIPGFETAPVWFRSHVDDNGRVTFTNAAPVVLRRK